MPSLAWMARSLPCANRCTRNSRISSMTKVISLMVTKSSPSRLHWMVPGEWKKKRCTSCLAEVPDNRERAFAEYFARRKENADALADLAVENFIEMRDNTASRTFRAKKKLDHALEAALPGIYLPLYTMVTFTRIPYAEAAQRARRQDSIIYTGLTLISAIIVALLIHFIA